MAGSQDPDQAEAAQAPDQRPLGFGAQLATMLRALAGSPEWRTVLWLSLAVVVVLAATAASQVALNAWNAPFYNAINERDIGTFVHELLVFFAIAWALLVLNVVQMWLNLMLQLKLRAGLMHNLLDLWLAPLRAFRMAHGGIFGVNPDQRLHEDTRHLSELTATLGIALLQASVLLCVFVVVLWRLSAGFSLHLFDHKIVVPGYMVWAALLYALLGSLASYRVGRSLIGLNAERYAREAELRSTLVRVSDHIGTIALHRGEASERRFLERDLGNVLGAMRAIVSASVKLTWVTAGYGWLTQIVPILVAAPVYFDGQISFGELMMAVGAFNQVQSSLRWFVDNFPGIADWRATLLRVADFRRAAIESEDLHGGAGRISVEPGEPGKLVIDRVVAAAQGQCTRIDVPRIEIGAGERVLITGDSGDAQTIFFRALAGLWPWGRGRIALPADESFVHVARRPYIRAGRLRDVLAYPDDPRGMADARFAAALEAVGLGAFADRLDEDARWDQDLGDQDQQRLAFARLALQAPPWIVIDQALDTLDAETHAQVVRLLTGPLEKSAIIAIGREDDSHKLFGRTYELVEDPEGEPLPMRAANRETAEVV